MWGHAYMLAATIYQHGDVEAAMKNFRDASAHLNENWQNFRETDRKVNPHRNLKTEPEA